MELTDVEKQSYIDITRLMLGDVPISVFYPILTDQEYYMLLEYHNWDLKKGARQAAFSILFYLTQVSYRERTGDIEVWNNASIEYRKALNDFIDSEDKIIPKDLVPYAAGISWEDVCAQRNNKDWARHPLAQVGFCTDWYTRVDGYEDLCECNGIQLWH